MTTIPDSLKKPVALVALGLALLGAGYACGRWAAPDKVVTHETVRTEVKTVEDTTSKAKVQELTAQLDTLKRSSHVVHTVVVKPDGTRTTQTVTDRQSVEVKQAEQVVQAEAESRVIKTVDKVHEVVKEKLIERERPKWFAGAMVTISPGTLRLDNAAASMSAGVVVGHMFGPFGLGLSVTVPVSQPVQVPTFGLSLTVAF